MKINNITLQKNYIARGNQCYIWLIGEHLKIIAMKYDHKTQFWFQGKGGDVSDQYYKLLKQAGCSLVMELYSFGGYSIIIDEKDTENLLQEVAKIDQDELLPGRSY